MIAIASKTQKGRARPRRVGRVTRVLSDPGFTCWEVVAPASTSNLGPGFDCLGLGLQLRMRVRAERIPSGFSIRTLAAITRLSLRHASAKSSARVSTRLTWPWVMIASTFVTTIS